MEPKRRRNHPPEGTQRAHGAVTDARHMVAQAMRRETELEEYQRNFVREVLKRAVGEISCLLESAWLRGGGDAVGARGIHFRAPMRSRGASGGVSSLHPPSSSTG